MLLKVLKLFFVFLFLSILSYLYFKYDPINNLLFPKCPLYATTGIYCPGCGSQRATHALLHFDLINVFKINFIFLPAILLIMYHIGLHIFNKILGTNYISLLDHSRAPIIVLVIVILFWILRNLPYFPFYYLAP